MSWKIGIIGGSGLCASAGLDGARWEIAKSPWGAPCDAILTGRIAGVEVCCLPRHGRRIPPHQRHVRAHIDTLKRLGCTDVRCQAILAKNGAILKTPAGKSAQRLTNQRTG